MPDPNVARAGAIALTQVEWPDGGTLDAVCSAEELTLEDDSALLRLSCAHPDTSMPVEVLIRFSEGAVDAQLDDLPGTVGLRVSFFNPPEGSIGCGSCSDLRMLDSDGRLVFLSKSNDLQSSVLDEGAIVDLSAATWLDAESPDYQTWSAPFESIQMRNAGCSARASMRPGAELETPLAVDFATGTSMVTVYDRGMDSLAVNDQLFDITVSDAFFRSEINCGDCPPTELSFLVLRSPD